MPSSHHVKFHTNPVKYCPHLKINLMINFLNYNSLEFYTAIYFQFRWIEKCKIFFVVWWIIDEFIRYHKSFIIQWRCYHVSSENKMNKKKSSIKFFLWIFQYSWRLNRYWEYLIHKTLLGSTAQYCKATSIIHAITTMNTNLNCFAKRSRLRWLIHSWSIMNSNNIAINGKNEFFYYFFSLSS